MKVVLVDCLTYQGLLRFQPRRTAASPDRDEPTTIRMKSAHWLLTTDSDNPAMARCAISADMRGRVSDFR